MMVKVCSDQVNGVNSITIKVNNTGGTDLENCVVTDNIFTSDATSPPTGSPTSVALDPPGTLPPPLAAGGMATVTAQLSWLASNACDDAAATCNTVGSTS